MKKIITLMFILLVGLMILGGCTSTSESSTAQQNQKDLNNEQQKQEQTETEELPQPPAFPEE